MLRKKKKQKTKHCLRGTLIFYWWGFRILGRFWKMYFCFFFFFLDWNDFNVVFILWLGRYFCQLHPFFFYFNGLFFFLFSWQENYYILEHKSKLVFTFIICTFSNNLYKYLSNTPSFLCFLCYFLHASQSHPELISQVLRSFSNHLSRLILKASSYLPLCLEWSYSICERTLQ